MNNLQQVSKSTFAVVTWDSQWGSYNNSYVVAAAGFTVLIDAGRRTHRNILCEALNALGRTPEEVDAIMYTHGHRDHIGGSILFPQLKNFIDQKDFELVPKSLRARFVRGFPPIGQFFGFNCIRLGFHTRGSVFFYYPEDKVLFCGDHLCFFGNRVANGRLVCSGPKLRVGLIKEYSKWAIQNREENGRSVMAFGKGIQTMADFPAEFLCTGHGPVLCGHITEFLREMLLAIE